MSGEAEFERMLAAIRALPKLGELAAPDVAETLAFELRKTIAAGTSPAGEQWKLTKADQRKPLVNAASAMNVGAIGSTVYVRLRGPEARHHLGRGRGKVVRQVIPVGELPPRLADAVREVLGWHFQEVVRG